MATLAMNAHVIASIVRARTNVPWWDGWAMIRELMLYQQGQPAVRSYGPHTGGTGWWCRGCFCWRMSGGRP